MALVTDCVSWGRGGGTGTPTLGCMVLGAHLCPETGALSASLARVPPNRGRAAPARRRHFSPRSLWLLPATRGSLHSRAAKRAFSKTFLFSPSMSSSVCNACAGSGAGKRRMCPGLPAPACPPGSVSSQGARPARPSSPSPCPPRSLVAPCGGSRQSQSPPPSGPRCPWEMRPSINGARQFLANMFLFIFL